MNAILQLLLPLLLSGVTGGAGGMAGSALAKLLGSTGTLGKIGSALPGMGRTVGSFLPFVMPSMMGGGHGAALSSEAVGQNEGNLGKLDAMMKSLSPGMDATAMAMQDEAPPMGDDAELMRQLGML